MEENPERKTDDYPWKWEEPSAMDKVLKSRVY